MSDGGRRGHGRTLYRCGSDAICSAPVLRALEGDGDFAALDEDLGGIRALDFDVDAAVAGADFEVEARAEHTEAVEAHGLNAGEQARADDEAAASGIGAQTEGLLEEEEDAGGGPGLRPAGDGIIGGERLVVPVTGEAAVELRDTIAGEADAAS